jgi:ADP-ribose pyrophosphatase YjhB (NUDIX family)
MKLGKDCIGVCVVYICYDKDGNFVMNKRGQNCRDEVGKWDCGGGALELHETVEDRLKKEIKEEYGADVLDYKCLGFSDVHRIDINKETHWISLDYKVLVDRKQVKNGEPHKLDDVKWFNWGTIPSLENLHSALAAWINKYRNELKEF